MGDHVILEWLNGSLVFFLFVLRNVERKAERLFLLHLLCL